MNAQPAALSGQIEQLEYVVYADVLKRPLDRHQHLLQSRELAVLPRRSVIRIELQNARERSRRVACALEVEQCFTENHQRREVVDIRPEQPYHPFERVARPAHCAVNGGELHCNRFVGRHRASAADSSCSATS